MAQILVVEDQPIVALVVEAWLADLGHNVIGPAGTLAEATLLAEQTLDAAILEVSVGNLSTAPLAARLAARGVPILVATGHDPADFDPAFAKAPVMPKPFFYGCFRQNVARLLRSGQAND